MCIAYEKFSISMSHAALARVFYAVGSKVILASRNVQQLEQLKFQLDNFQLEEEKTQQKVGSCLCGEEVRMGSAPPPRFANRMVSSLSSHVAPGGDYEALY